MDTDFEQEAPYVNRRLAAVADRPGPDSATAAIFGEVAHQARDLWDAGRRESAFRCLQETGLSEQETKRLGFMLWQIRTGQRPAPGS